MNGVSITYGDIAVEAKENFDIDVSEQFSDTVANLKKYNMELYNYADPCELYQTVLDGESVPIPDPLESANIGLWSEQLSGDDGVFATPITIALESEGQYSSQGFTFAFDKFNDIYPNRLTIQWFRVTSDNMEDLSGVVEFHPSSGYYFCHNKVENFNKVIITFYSMNMPNNRLKIETLDYGYGTVFYGDSLRSVKVSQSIDPISTEIKIDTCDFTVARKTDVEYTWQSKQPLAVGFNGDLIATTFVKSSTRNGRYVWDVKSEDYIGILENVPYVGGMYEDTPATDILTDIFTVAKVPYFISDNLNDITVTGYISYTTCREALMQVCFACMAVVNTSYSDVIEVKLPENDIKQTIPLSRIKRSPSFKSGDTVTSVELTVHTYEPTDETIELYNQKEDGKGENILVKFSEPVHDLSIIAGDILESGTNYARINARFKCVLSGSKYNHTQEVVSYKNPLVLATETENVLSVKNATTVSKANADSILQNCYDWLTKTDTATFNLVVGNDISRETHTVRYGEIKLGACRYADSITREVLTKQKDVHLGDVIETETEYKGDINGRVIQQSFNLNGNIMVKETIMK